MDSYKLGRNTLVAYVIMSIISWSIAEALPEVYTLTMFVAVCIISIVLWYEAIRRGMTESISDGIIVSLFFIVPYGLIVLISYQGFFRDELRDAFSLLIWTLFTHPMSILHAEMRNVNSINFAIFEPFLIIGILIIINTVMYLLKTKNKN
jgi:hypothetical protein